MKMSRQLTLQFTEDTLTCSQADSPASPSASQAKDEARRITATYGARCCEQLKTLSHVGLWAKMFSVLLVGRTEWYSSRCNLIWRMRGTKCNRILFQLAPSMRPIDETECGLLPTVGMLKTPSVMDSYESLATAKKNPTSGNSGCLAQEIANGYVTKRGLLLPTVVTQGLKYCNKKGQSAFVNPQFLPTPNAVEGEKWTKKLNPSSQMGMSLTARAMNGLLPTPLATEVSHPKRIADLKAKGGGQTMGSRKNGESRPNGIQDYLTWHGLMPTVKAQDYRHALHDRGKSNLGEEIAEAFGDGTSQNSPLSPLFVAEMMGFPIDWTLAPFLDGLKSTSDGDSVAGGEKNQ